MLSYNEDAPRQEEINFRSFPAHSRLPVPAGSCVGAHPAAPGTPQQGDCVCKPSQLGALGRGLLFLLNRGAKPAPDTALGALGHSMCCLPTPHNHCCPCSSQPLGAKGSSRLSCGSVQNKTTPLAKSQDHHSMVWVERALKAHLVPLSAMGKDTSTIPGCLQACPTWPWTSQRHWRRSKIMNRFSCPCLGTGTRDWGAGTHGVGAWWVHVAGKDLGFPVSSFSNQVPSSFPVWQPLSLE